MYKKRAMRPRGLTEAEAFAWFMPGPPPPPDQCWNWTASCHGSGWGQFGVTVDGRHKNTAAHCAAYRIYHGPVPPGLLVLHTCKKNPGCCQPAHLYAGKRTRKPRVPKIRATTEERFWKRVDKNGPTDPLLGTPCWIWRATNRHWDGRKVAMARTPTINVSGKLVSAVRYSYELAAGTIERNRNLRRRCKNRLCVNPQHLTLGPQPCPRRSPTGVGSYAALTQSNKARQRDAAERRITAAITAIPIIRRIEPHYRFPTHVKDTYLTVLAARIEHPDATLADLGYHLGITKDACAATLRRALAVAHQ